MPSAILCRRCNTEMTLTETITTPGDGPHIEMHECPECQLRSAVTFEPVGGFSEQQKSWVEQQIAQRGSFFPSDFTQTRGPRY